MPLTCQAGQKGRLLASDLEFEIVCTHGPTTCIRFRDERSIKHGDHEFADSELCAVSENIIGWGIRVVDKKTT